MQTRMSGYMKTHLFLAILSLYLLSPKWATSQDMHVSGQNEREPKSAVLKKPLKNILKSFETEYHIQFAYDDQLIDGMIVASSIPTSKNLDENLTRILSPLGLSYKQVDKSLYVIRAAPVSRKPITKKPWKTNILANSERTITGKVTDEKGGAAIGVSLLLKGTATGTSTDTEGNFSMIVPDDGGTLVVSYIGYLTKELVIGNSSNVEIQLLPDSKILNEVVVVGYGVQKKIRLNGLTIIGFRQGHCQPADEQH